MNKLERLHTAAITGSSADSLAAIYGMGMSLDRYATALQPGARLLDVGAGRSPLLLEIARQRDDVECTAMDYHYRDPSVVNPLRATAHGVSNMQYISGDVFNPSENLYGQFDLVLSSGLIEHAIRVARDYGRVGLENLLNFSDSEGQVRMRRPPLAKRVNGLGILKRVVLLNSDAETEQIESALDAMTLTGWANFLQDAQDASGVKIQPAKKFNMGRGLMLMEDGNQNGYRLNSKQGLIMSTRLAKGFLQRSKFSKPPKVTDYISRNH